MQKVTMEEVIQVIGVKSNFRGKNYFSLLQTFRHHLPVTQRSAVNRLFGTVTSKLDDHDATNYFSLTGATFVCLAWTFRWI